MPSKFSTPTKASNVCAAPSTAGGVKGVARVSRWASLVVDSDSDSDRSCPPAPKKAAFQSPALLPLSPPAAPVTPVSLTFAEMLASDPVMAALHRGDLLWGDVMYMDPDFCAQEEAATVERLAAHKANEARLAAESQATVESWAVSEAALWDQPFATNLEVHFGDHYDLSGLTDAEYEDFMRYVYANGVHVEEGDRAYCYATPSGEPARTWTRDTGAVGHGTGRFDSLRAPEPAHKHHGCCGHAKAAPAALSAPGSDAGRRKGAPVPRFCRAAKACEDEGCRYVHGDSIPRVNKPCGFGEGCGASDPTGVKRSQCLFMHPGETWSASLVIKRV